MKSAGVVDAVKKKSVKTPSVSVPKVVVCIPAYRAEDTIAKVVVGSKRFADQVIVCDDGSDDLTFDICKSLGAVVVKHEQSMGYGSTLRTLFRNAIKSGADFVVTIDGDGLYDPFEIPVLLDRLIRGDVDVVIGSRFLKESSGASVSSSNAKLTDGGSGFRTFTIKALEDLHITEEGVPYNSDFLVNAQEKGMKIAEVPIHSKSTVEASSAASTDESLGGVLGVLKGVFIEHPLLVFGLPGILASIAGIGFWVYTIMMFFWQNYTSQLMSTLGVAALSIGVILIVASIVLWVLQPQIKKNKV